MNRTTVPTTTFDAADKSNAKSADSRGLVILTALSATRKHVYGGTVPAAEVDRRRAKNRAARAARRANRKAAAR